MVRTLADDETLLRDALDLPTASPLALLSREPLGDGSVSGFSVDADGAGTATYFVDTSRRPVAVETGMLLGEPAAPEARVWLHPADPHLPALAPVAFEDAAVTLLGRLDLHATGSPTFVGYRPGRRAVVRVPARDGIVWVKIVPPRRVERIVETHRVLGEHGIPVPEVRGWSREGLVVLADARGTAATETPWQPETLLDEVDALRERLGRVALPFEASTGLERRLDWYVPRLTGLLDDEGGALVREIAGTARSRWDTGSARTTVHGDLHLGQLFLAGEAVSGLIDVDTAGCGIPSDDAAAFLSHAIASALLTPSPRDARVWTFADAAIARWCGAGREGDGCRARAATHLLGHALSALEAGDVARGTALLGSAATVVARSGGAR